MEPGYYFVTTWNKDERVVVKIDANGQAWYGSTEFHASHFRDFDRISDPREPRKDGEG